MTIPDQSHVIGALNRAHVTIDLKTVELCFLAALYLRADREALDCFEEDLLIDIFERVCDSVDSSTENLRKRATHSVQRLRDQRMLSRVDGAGIVRAGQYTLTRLAASIVEYFLTDEALTRDSLTLLTRTLRAQLVEILAAAKTAKSDDAWSREVGGALRVTVRDLVSGIERRQRGLDAQQEEIQAKIADLLRTNWFVAIEQCQELLDTTANTLKELNEVLLHDTQHFIAILQEIQALATTAENSDAEETSQRVIENVDRIAAWGAARQQAWSRYYQYVHGYLRDVVRLDPDRALSHRLREQVAGWITTPFYMIVAHAPSIRLLRPTEARFARPAVIRLRENRERQPIPASPEDLAGDIDTLVREALNGGADTLAAVTAQVLPSFAPEFHYAATGRIAEAVARITKVRSQRERPWRHVVDHLEIEDWTLSTIERTR